MIFDTDILIWAQRGNLQAAHLINKTSEKRISILTYMELLQGAHNKREHRYTKDFLYQYNFEVLPLTENIGHRALIYIEEHGLATGIRVVDALIAATAMERNLTLASSNRKHFKNISDLPLYVFKP
jgi:predicted nucleic acid-binding protein